MAPEFRLDVHDLDAAGKTYSDAIRPSWLRGALEGCDVTPAGEDGFLRVRYSKTGNDVVIRGHAKAKLVTSCARCLEPVAFDAAAEIALLLVPESSPRAPFAKGKAGKSAGKAAKDEELAPEDAELDTYSGDEVVLDAFVREALLLEVPQFPLCSENCHGIAPPPDEGSSTQPAVDPRLAPLLRFAAQAKPKKDASLPGLCGALNEHGGSQAKNDPVQRQDAPRPARQGDGAEPRPLLELRRASRRPPRLPVLRFLQGQEDRREEAVSRAHGASLISIEAGLPASSTPRATE